MTTPAAAPGPLRPIRLLFALVTLAAFTVGVPALLWWSTDGGFLPDPGAGGWEEVRAALEAGQVPDAAVLTVMTITGWLIWAYLIIVMLSEVVITWRERKAAASDRHLTGPRLLVARAVTWAFATHSFAASALLTSPNLAATPVAAVTMLDDDATPGPVSPEAPTPDPRPSDRFDPEAYIDFVPEEEPVADQPGDGADTGAAATEDDVYPVIVEKGDTLWAIAAEHTGDPLNYPELWAATDHAAQTPPLDPDNPDLIYPGNTINVPADLVPDSAEPPPASGNPAPGSPATTTPRTPDTAVPGTAATTVPGIPATTSTPKPAAPPPPTGAQPAPDSTTGDQSSVAPPPATTTTSAADPAPSTTGSPADRDLDDGRSAALVLTGLAGIGAAAAGLILAGVRRRRRVAMAVAHGGERPPRHTPVAERTERRLRARDYAGPELWPADNLIAGWDSLLPEDPGGAQPWAFRWNSDSGNLECAWTEDPGLPASPDGAAVVPGPGSPWRLETRPGSSTQRDVWVLRPEDVPARPPQRVLPGVVNCAEGIAGRSAGEGFYLNLEAAGMVSVSSTDPDLDAEGIARALLVQLQANSPIELHLLATDLGLPAPLGTIHDDPLDLEARVVERLTRHQDTWDQARSMFALRTAGAYHGAPTVVVGSVDLLQSCSHLLSLANTPNIPLILIGLGDTGWATLRIQIPPDRHIIRIQDLGASLSVDHISWASPDDAADLIHLLDDATTPWTTDPDLMHPMVRNDPPLALDHESLPDVTAPFSTDHQTDPVPDSPDEEPEPLSGAADHEQSAEDPRPERDQLGGSTAEEGYEEPLPEPLPEPFDEPPSATAPPPQQQALNLPDIPAAHQHWRPDQRRRDTESHLTTEPGNRPPDPLSDVADSDPMAAAARLNGSTIQPNEDTDPDPGNGPPTPTSEPVPAPTDQLDDDPHPAAQPACLPRRSQAPRPVGESGLRVEVCGPIRALHLGPEGVVEVPTGSDGFTAGQLSLLAYLALGTARRGGIDLDTATQELWPDNHTDGTYRTVHPDTFKKRIWDLRRAFKALLGSEGAKDVLPDAANHLYSLTGIAIDWTELATALDAAENSRPGRPEFTVAVDEVLALVRPPGVLTPPPARQGTYSWLHHYELLIHDTTRRIQAVLADHGNHLIAAGHSRQALDALAIARATSPNYARPIATGTVRAHLALGDHAAAEREVLIYEAQLDPALTTRERTNPSPGGPRAALQGLR